MYGLGQGDAHHHDHPTQGGQDPGQGLAGELRGNDGVAVLGGGQHDDERTGKDGNGGHHRSDHAPHPVAHEGRGQHGRSGRHLGQGHAVEKGAFVHPAVQDHHFPEHDRNDPEPAKGQHIHLHHADGEIEELPVGVKKPAQKQDIEPSQAQGQRQAARRGADGTGQNARPGIEKQHAAQGRAADDGHHAGSAQKQRRRPGRHGHMPGRRGEALDEIDAGHKANGQHHHLEPGKDRYGQRQGPGVAVKECEQRDQREGRDGKPGIGGQGPGQPGPLEPHPG